MGTIIKDDEQHQEAKKDGDHGHDEMVSSFGVMMQSSSSSLTSSPFLPGMTMKMLSSSSSNFPISRKDGGAYEFGHHLDQALFLFLDHNQQHQIHNENLEMGTPPTLDIFPSHHHQAVSSPPINDPPPAASSSSPPQLVKSEGGRKGSSQHHGPKATDPKTLRRLAQNREAARKSRLRRKAYVQQLETSRIRLTHLEEELQRARSQGLLHLGGTGMLPLQGGGASTASIFDMEYSKWQEDHQRMVTDLRNAAKDSRIPENELRTLVENCLSHYDQIMNLKNMMAKSDAFHLLSGVSKTPAERCFMWLGVSAPPTSSREVESLTDGQVIAICGLQESTQEAEVALTQGMEALCHSISQAIVADSLLLPLNSNSYMSSMTLAITKLSTLQNFLTQADHLRLQTLHRLHQILTTHQVAQCLLAVAEYFNRLQALSSLWLSRPPRHD